MTTTDINITWLLQSFGHVLKPFETLTGPQFAAAIGKVYSMEEPKNREARDAAASLPGVFSMGHRTYTYTPPPAATCPKETPWGRADHTKELFPGCWSVSTPSHGGFYVSPAVLELIPECLKAETWEDNGRAGLAAYYLKHGGQAAFQAYCDAK